MLRILRKTIRYDIPGGKHKTVVLFLAECTQQLKIDSREIENHLWLTPEETKMTLPEWYRPVIGKIRTNDVKGLLMTEFISKEPINKGWSGDKKYCVTDEQGKKFLLRVSPIEQYERKKSEYELMSQVAALGVPMCRPLEFGTSDEGVYSIQTWIDGVDAEENAHNLTSDEQYSYGFEAGRILKEIHKIPAPEGIEDWEIYFNRKADRKIKMYEECPIKYENGQAFIDYINAHRHLLSGRPRTYQHGDYHIGNMMIGNDKQLYIIDFNRNDFGDPWEEFNRIVWCAQANPSVCYRNGQRIL